MVKAIQQQINNLLKQDKRITQILKRITYLSLSCKNSIQYINKAIKSTSNPIKHLKLLTLLHECCCSKTLPSKQAFKILTQIKSTAKKNNQLHKILCTNYLPQYILYLQKCYQYNIQQIQNIQTFTPQQQLFKKINLLRYGVEFVQILFIFGRYYAQTYTFIIDLNIVLAKDIKSKYDDIKRIILANKMLLDQGLKYQLEKVHEKMYIVFYNCYYHKSVTKFQPTWIDTHIKTAATKDKKKCKNMQDLISSIQIKKKQIKQQRSASVTARKNKNISTFSTIQKTKIQKTAIQSTCEKTAQYSKYKVIQNEQICVSQFMQQQKQVSSKIQINQNIEVSQFKQYEQDDDSCYQQQQIQHKFKLLLQFKRIAQLAQTNYSGIENIAFT